MIIGAVLLALAAGGAGFAVGRASAGSEPTVAATPATRPATSTAPSATPSNLPATTTRVAADIPSTAIAGRSGSWVYSVSSNYPVTIGYTDSNGDEITATNVPAPWTITFPTDKWGADAYPHLFALSSSSKGDTTVTCTITDDQGRVRATQTRSAAHASASCAIYS